MQQLHQNTLICMQNVMREHLLLRVGPAGEGSFKAGLSVCDKMPKPND